MNFNYLINAAFIFNRTRIHNQRKMYLMTNWKTRTSLIEQSDWCHLCSLIYSDVSKDSRIRALIRLQIHRLICVFVVHLCHKGSVLVAVILTALGKRRVQIRYVLLCCFQVHFHSVS